MRRTLYELRNFEYLLINTRAAIGNTDHDEDSDEKLRFIFETLQGLKNIYPEAHIRPILYYS